MRSTPIITIIRKYGLNSKRLNPKNRIKYEDAIKAVRKYQNSSLRIDSVVDNSRTPSHNGCHCGVPGCGQRIRYEYILKSKDSDDDKELVAGSTCVWPTLGMSELEKKDFFRFDAAIREHYALKDWEEENPDVVQKLKTLKGLNATYYRAFWEEVQTSALTPEDTEFIRSVDVDKEVEKAHYRERFKNVDAQEYRRAIGYLPELRAYKPNDGFIKSLSWSVNSGKRLSGNQYRWLKVLVNRMWYDKKVKGTPRDIYDSCEGYIQPYLERHGFKGNTDFTAIDAVEGDIGERGSDIERWAWNLFKVKNAIVH